MGVVRLVCRLNGSGLERDKEIIENELLAQGHEVHHHDNRETDEELSDVDATIFVEHLDRRYLSSLNIFFPNPEWVLDRFAGLIDDVDVICCKTRDALRIFRHTGKAVFTSFTSFDRYRPEVIKQDKILHSCNRSNQKGTEEVIEAWKLMRDHPSSLTVTNNKFSELSGRDMDIINEKLPEDDYMRLQNEHFIHLCPSNYEGFGHFINEPLSMGCHVMAVNAPPMNEMIPPSALIPINYGEVKKRKLASTYIPRPKDIAKALSHADHSRYGHFNEEAREVFVKRDRFFKERFGNLMEEVL